MKTGSETTNRTLPESFYILLLGIDAILKRDSFKDCVHFKQHNLGLQVTSELFASSVCFNLHSEYGVGKKLEPLIFELFCDLELDPDKYEKNIFFQEVVKNAHIILPLIRKADSKDEVLWTYNYAIESLNKADAISVERMERLMNLFLDYEQEDEEGNVQEDIEDDIHEEIDENEENEKEENENEEKHEKNKRKPCICKFCNEFSQFHFPRDEYAEKIILNALLHIDSKTRIS